MSDTQTRRRHALERLRSETFDMLIIGGGINGAGIARDAALRGYNVALLEMEDYAFGTSSRSSKLIHGGLRYLEQLELGLVFESVSERHILSRTARHVVRPLPFVFPAFKGKGAGRFTLTVGLWTYDGLALFRNYKNHRSLSPAAVRKELPGLRPTGLRGGVLYYDYQTNDARLVLENVLAAEQQGALELSYAEVESFELVDEGPSKVVIRDRLGDQTLEAKGFAIVCAAGPWTDRVTSLSGDHRRWLRPTKGVHIVVPKNKLPVERAVALRHPRDGRVHFILPFYERTVIGTTDTDYAGDPAQVEASYEDVEYLVESGRYFFPEAPLHIEDVIATWAGLRPLVNVGDAAGPSDVSREHHIETLDGGLVVIAGGKLTTYRKMSAECVDVAAAAVAKAGGPARKKGVDTTHLPLPGAVGLRSDDDLATLAERLNRRVHDEEVSQHLAFTYGVRADQLLEEAPGDRPVGERMVPELPFIWAEVDHAARHELAHTITDVLERRIQMLFRDRDQGLGVLEEVADRMAAVHGWDAETRSRHVQAYKETVARNRAWRSGLSAPAEAATTA